MKIGWMLIGLFCLNTVAWAEALTPEEAAVQAVRHNRDLSAARWMVAEAQGRLVQAGLWKNPDLELMHERDEGRDSMRGQRFGAGFMQRFPLAGRLNRARAVARVDVAMAREEWLEARRRLTGETLATAREALILERKLAVQRESRALLETIRQQATAWTASGKGAASDVLMTELEEAQLALKVESLEVERRAVLARLAGLLGREGAAAERLRVVGMLPAVPSAAELRDAGEEALSRRPDRRLAVLRLDRNRAETALARAERWEDVALGVEVMRETDRRDAMVGVRVSIPLPLWDRKQGTLAELRAAGEKRRGELDALDLTINTEIREARQRLLGTLATEQRAKGATLDLARRATTLLTETYAAGSAPFLSVFESRRQQIAVEELAVDLEGERVRAFTEWETRTGHFRGVPSVAEKEAPQRSSGKGKK